MIMLKKVAILVLFFIGWVTVFSVLYHASERFEEWFGKQSRLDKNEITLQLVMTIVGVCMIILVFG